MWRHDSARRGASSEELPESLHLQWTIELPRPRPAWPPEQERLQFDRLYEPVLAAKALFVCSMVNDRITAFDAETGEELWRFYADGPLRFAPAVWEGRVYFVSDDGHLYCLAARDGRLLWKFRGGPGGRKVLGNHRLVSAWPARGAPVVHEGTVYFGASVWPFLGTFIHALDGETGQVVWTNSETGSSYRPQQHDSPAFAGVSPQGYLAVAGDRLLVAGGRSVPAVFDRTSGELLHFDLASRATGLHGGGGYEVICGNDFYLNRGYMYRLENGQYVAPVDALVVDDELILGHDQEGIRAYRAGWKEVVAKDRRGKQTRKTVVELAWKAPLEPRVRQVFLRSGTRVYAGGTTNEVLAIDLPRPNRGARVSWQAELPDAPLNMIAGDGKLFVTTDEGRIYCFGGVEDGSRALEPSSITLVPRGATWKYLDSGDEPDKEWSSPVFDDSSWKDGPAQLGYGDSDEATVVSYGPDPQRKRPACYFRHDFRLDSPAAYDRLHLDLLVDDGAVVYLNGEEVARLFMPDGDIRHGTLAKPGAVEGKYQALRIGLEAARAGRNVLAVRVHQVRPTSSDLSFDLELRAHRKRPRGAAHRKPTPSRRLRADVSSELLRATGAAEGYAVALGLGRGRLLGEVLAESDLHVIALEPDPAKVAAYRRVLDARGLYGTRVAVVPERLHDADLPPYLADLIFTEGPAFGAADLRPETIQILYRSLRPFGGALAVATTDEEHEAFASLVAGAGLEGAVLERSGELTVLRRPDAPAGAGEWTHQYANAGNTVASSDTLVKPPLGLLWFGGPSHEGVLPRHGHGPNPQVSGGRLFIEGRDMLRAMDMYTGRLLWERALKDVGKHYDYTTHEPGANILGSNYVSLRDAVYVVHENRCLRLDPATGETVAVLQLPRPTGAPPPDWGYLGVWDRWLVAGSGTTKFAPAEYTESAIGGTLKDAKLKEALGWPATWKDFQPSQRGRGQGDLAWLADNLNRLLHDEEFLDRVPPDVRRAAGARDEEDELRRYVAGGEGRTPTDYGALVIRRRLLERYYGLPAHVQPRPGKSGSIVGSASKRLTAFDRHSGEALWEHETQHEARHNAIALGGGNVFLIDRLSDVEAGYFRRRGREPPDTSSLTAVDIRTGDVLWQDTQNVFGTWLGYSEEHDVLLQAGSNARDRAKDEAISGLAAYRGSTGEVLWQSSRAYNGPCILLGKMVITQTESQPGVALNLLDGKEITVPHPVTGTEVPWRYTRNYGCNTAVGARHLLTFRSAAAGYYDLAGDSGTGNLGGFRSGCTSNLIPAGGILNAPDYTRTCTCSYQNQTSLALVHDPEAQMWTFSPHPRGRGDVRTLGLNFGAPGDRRDTDGVLWLESPVVGGNSPGPGIRVTSSDGEFVRHDPTYIEGGPLAWVASSAFLGSGKIDVPLRSPELTRVANEVPGSPHLELSGAVGSSSVPSATLPGSKVRNRRSLGRRGQRSALRARARDVATLAVPSVTVEFFTRTTADFNYLDARAGGAKKDQGFVLDNRRLRARYFVANRDGDGPDPVVTIQSKKVIPDGQWAHVAFTYTAVTGTGRLYLDGALVGTHEGPRDRSLWWWTARPDLLVAAEAPTGCLIDEVRISNRALQRDELLCVGTEHLVPGVTAYWRMEPARAAGGADAETYTVHMVFAELEDMQPGERVFRVTLQGTTVLDAFDIARSTGARRHAFVREFRGVAVEGDLTIGLEPQGRAAPSLSGVRVVREPVSPSRSAPHRAPSGAPR